MNSTCNAKRSCRTQLQCRAASQSITVKAAISDICGFPVKHQNDQYGAYSGVRRCLQRPGEVSHGWCKKWDIRPSLAWRKSCAHVILFFRGRAQFLTRRGVIHKNPQLRRRVYVCDVTLCILQYNAQKQTHPLGPWQDGRDCRERLCRTSFELYTPLLLEIPTKHPQDLSSEAEVRRPSPDHKEADSLEGLRQVQDQGHSSLFFRLCSSIKSFHFHQYFPHCSLSSSVPIIRRVALNPILLLPLRHFWCSPSFAPTYQRWHERS